MSAPRNGATKRKLPIGIQTFLEIREEGYCYVDKNAHVQRLAHESKHYFLSHPRLVGLRCALPRAADQLRLRPVQPEGPQHRRLQGGAGRVMDRYPSSMRVPPSRMVQEQISNS